MSRCAMCFLDKPLKAVQFGMETMEEPICRGCELAIDRVVGFLQRAGLGVQRSFDLGPTPQETEQAESDGEAPTRKELGRRGSAAQRASETP